MVTNLNLGESPLSEKQSWRNWLILIGILVVTAVLAGAWPALTNTFTSSGSTAGTPGMEIPVLEIPVPSALIPTLEGMITITNGVFALNGLVAVIGLTVIVILATAGMGVGLAFAYRFLDNLTNQEKGSETFQQKQTQLEKREKERILAAREGRDPTPAPEHKMPRWSRLANVLIFWLFLIFTGMIFNRTFYPTGEIILEPGSGMYNLLTGLGQPPVFDTSWLFVGLPTLLLVPLLYWWLRPQLLEAADETDYGDIPWDTLAVIFTGLLVVGLGVAYMVYLAIPG
jgi:hypothetical protein